MAKIAFFVTEDWYFCSHRLPLAVAAKSAGHSVTVFTRVRNHGEVIRSNGLDLVPIELSRRGGNIVTELSLIVRLIRAYRRYQPDLVHHVALKPVVYGSLAARIARVHHVVNAIAGLGYIYSSRHLRAKVLRPILTALLGVLLKPKGVRVIVQNPDDRSMLIERGLARDNQMSLIRGSGVDLATFFVRPEPGETPLVILPARMLWDKGVGEFVEAAGLLRESGIDARFALVGAPDEENPGTVPVETLRAWNSSGVVEWWGQRDDMPDVYAKSSIVCLPTVYGEGLPKSLLEAAACGRAIVATDAPGCREIVRERVNGLLVPAKDVKALAEALKTLIDDNILRARMGRLGRELVETEFTIDKVIKQTFSIYEDLLRCREC